VPQPSSNDAIRVTSASGAGIGISEPVFVSMEVRWIRGVVGVVSGERGYGVIRVWREGYGG
jgi:hypothetical protein